MRSFKAMLIIAVLSAGLASCQSGADLPQAQNTPQVVAATSGPTSVPDAQQKRAMYRAVIDAFLQDEHVQALFDADVFSRKVVYIQPTFFDTHEAIPPDIVEMILAHTSARGISHSDSEQTGGAVIRLGALGNDPAVATLPLKPGPTIRMWAWVSGNECGPFVGFGYIVTPNEQGWQATQYVTSTC